MARFGACRQIAAILRFLHAGGNAFGNDAETGSDPFLENRAHTREFLTETTEHASEISILAILVARCLEELADASQRRKRMVAEGGIEAIVNIVHVAVDNLQGKVLFAGEVMVERSLRHARFFQDRLDAEIVVAVAQEHPQPRIEHPLPGGLAHWRIACIS